MRKEKLKKRDGFILVLKVVGMSVLFYPDLLGQQLLSGQVSIYLHSKEENIRVLIPALFRCFIRVADGPLFKENIFFLPFFPTRKLRSQLFHNTWRSGQVLLQAA